MRFGTSTMHFADHCITEGQRFIAASALMLTIGSLILAGASPQNACAESNRAESEHQAAAPGIDLSWGNPAEEPHRHALWGSPAEMGQWYRVPMAEDPNDRMQAIHSVVLPNGKVLMVSGSSFRLILKSGIPLEEIEGDKRQFVDQTAIFNPDDIPFDPNAKDEAEFDPPYKKAQSSFKRIPSPVTPFGGEPNDLFCAGHLHTPDGNVLFVSGTRINKPKLLFPGHLCVNLFDWRKYDAGQPPWKTTKPLKDGHWYPTMLELPNGHLVAISGFKREFGNPPMPANSHFAEIYDPRTEKWTAVDISKAEGPFTAEFTYHGVKMANDKPVLDAEGRPVLEMRTHKDELDHYPRVLPLPDGRFLVTGDGSGGGNPLCHYTYLMKIDLADPAQPKITFEQGAPRPSSRRVYGTALIDPNSPRHDLLLIGGMLNGPNEASLAVNPSKIPPALEVRSAMLGPFRNPLPEERIDLVTRDMFRYRPPAGPGDPGAWETTPNFLGDRFEDRRIQATAVILPTKEFLVMGGGNFFFDRPVFAPRLYTPDASTPGGYRSRQMNPATQPRLYHSVALLLPDGRIFTASGNAARATMDANGKGPGDEYRYNFIKRHPVKNTYAFVEPGEFRISSENHQIELYSPPYLFIKGERPKFRLPKPGEFGGPGGTRLTIKVEHPTEAASLVMIKLPSVTHAWDMGQRLVDLAPSFRQETGGVINFEIPRDRIHCPPGYYMLFYVNSRGQPVEKAAMVQIE